MTFAFMLLKTKKNTHTHNIQLIGGRSMSTNANVYSNNEKSPLTKMMIVFNLKLNKRKSNLHEDNIYYKNVFDKSKRIFQLKIHSFEKQRDPTSQ